MSLQGSIETFAVADVLRLLAATSKAGRLHVQGPTRSGTVWVAESQILAADSPSTPHASGPVDIVFQLLRFERGSFRFEPDRQPAQPTTPLDIEFALGEAESMLQEWRELEARIPSGEAWVSLRPAIDAAAVTLSSDEWATVVRVSSGRTVTELGDVLELGEVQTARLVARLLDLGLVEVGVRPASGAEAGPVPGRVEVAAAEPAAAFGAGEFGAAEVASVVETDEGVTTPAAAWSAPPAPPAPPVVESWTVPTVFDAPAASFVPPVAPADEARPAAGLAAASAERVFDAADPGLFSFPAGPETELYTYPPVADVPTAATTETADDGYPALPPPLPPVYPPVASAADDSSWIGSLAEAIERSDALNAGTPVAEDLFVPPGAPSGHPAPPPPPAPPAPVGSWGSPASLFKNGTPERLAPPPPPPPPPPGEPAVTPVPAQFAGTPPAPVAEDETVILADEPGTDDDIERQLFNLSPRAREAVKQSTGLYHGRPGR